MRRFIIGRLALVVAATTAVVLGGGSSAAAPAGYRTVDLGTLGGDSSYVDVPAGCGADRARGRVSTSVAGHRSPLPLVYSRRPILTGSPAPTGSR
jgi:hypothetical protein